MNALAANHASEVTAYLLRDTLKHIVHLKAMSAYSEHISSHYFCLGAAAGVLCLYPTRVTTYESVNYPDTQYVALIASDCPAVTERMLEYLPQNDNFVLKLMSPEDKAVVERKFVLSRVTSFLSYTAPAMAHFTKSKHIAISHELDDDLLPFFRANGYERGEVEGFIKSGTAVFFAAYAGDQPVSACIAYEITAMCGKSARSTRFRRQGAKVMHERLLKPLCTICGRTDTSPDIKWTKTMSPPDNWRNTLSSTVLWRRNIFYAGNLHRRSSRCSTLNDASARPITRHGRDW